MNCRKCGKIVEGVDAGAFVRLYNLPDNEYGKTEVLCMDCTDKLEEWFGPKVYEETTGK